MLCAHEPAMPASALSVLAYPPLRFAPPSLSGASYNLGEGGYGEDGEEGWPLALVLALQAHVGWLQPLLTPDNHDALLALLLGRLAERLEAVLSQKRFTQLGGLALERQLHTLLGECRSWALRGGCTSTP